MMKKCLPSPKTFLLGSVATLLGVCSLPTAPTWTHTLHPSAHMTAGAVATIAPPMDLNPSLGGNQTLPKSSAEGTGGVQQKPSLTGLKTVKLRIRVIDGRTFKPLEGAQVVLIETGQRLTTAKDGMTGQYDAPIIRNPKYGLLVAELHGQLGAISYKNGYHDSIHLGIRVQEGTEAETTIWMYKIEQGDRRIEPILYEVPYHHLWLINLADRFRDKSQVGEGFQNP